MSLQVWLPLNGNLNNNGLSTGSITNYGSTVDNSGKFGKCYIFDGTDDAILVPFNSFVTDEWSFSVWFYKSGLSSKNYDTIFGGPSGFEIETRDGAGTNPVIVGLNWDRISIPYEFNKWNHFVVTRNSAETKWYMNGELKATASAGSIPSGNYFIGAWNVYNSQNFKGKLNDVRIYNHCLSMKEIKEISKGLCLHYKLDGNYFGNPNLLTNSMSEVTGTYSSGSYIDFKSWGGITVSANEVYTLSFDAKSTVDGQSLTTYFYNNSSGIVQVASSKTNQGKTSTSADGYNTYTLSTNYKRYWCTFTFNSTSTSASKTVLFRLFSGNATIKNVKLEKGGCDTPWVPNSSDSVYTTLGYNKYASTEYDCSGFNNNGTKYGTIYTRNNSRKYERSEELNGNDNSIGIGNLSSIIPEGIFTMNIWFYHDSTWSSKTFETIFGGPGGFELELKISSTNTPVLYTYSWGRQQASYPLNNWNMLTMTRTSSETKFYLNGSQVLTGDAGSIPSGNYFIGAWNSSSQQNYKGLVQDFRLYTTILSEKDIKELYNAPISITKSGSLMCSELVEIE